MKALFHAAVLVAKGYLEVKNLLARALEAEMPGFNYAGMHRPDRDLMNLAALHAEEFPGSRGGARPRPHGLQPRMATRHDAVLLPCLALEEVRLRVDAGQGWIAAAGGKAPPGGQRVVRVEC
ncbi:MAG TPA: hypothetical protein VKG78_02830, partial [Opitutaceae bacterium]|nr:hypothetical protein [Opitutaceae bacterium]